MIWWIAVPLLAATAVLQTAIFRRVMLLDGSLDLLIVIVVCWSLLRPEEGMGWALAAGSFADLFSGGPFGVTAIAYLLASFAAGLLHGRLRTDSPLAVMAITLGGTVLSHLAMIILLAVFGRRPDIGYVIPYVTLPGAFLNTLCAVPVYLSLRRLHIAGIPVLAREEE
jgi:rod shape-determining protein MreD